ncbi:MAG: hypothetical protein ACPGRX_01745 [Bdellovibrionales bacterium]
MFKKPEKRRKITIMKLSASKTLVRAALLGLMSAGSLAACTTAQDKSHNKCSASGCNQKKEAHSCSAKSSCNDKSSCSSKNSCSGTNSCNSAK